MPNERNPSEPCDIVPSCPICGALMELSRRVGQIHVCVCTDCGTTLSVSEDALARYRKGARQRQRG